MWKPQPKRDLIVFSCILLFLGGYDLYQLLRGGLGLWLLPTVGKLGFGVYGLLLQRLPQRPVWNGISIAAGALLALGLVLGIGGGNALPAVVSLLVYAGLQLARLMLHRS